MGNRFQFSAAIFAIAFPALVLLFFLLQLAIHSRRIKRNPSSEGLVGLTGRAESDVTNGGFVFVRGELWPARSDIKITRGKRVRVVGCSKLKLDVEIA